MSRLRRLHLESLESRNLLAFQDMDPLTPPPPEEYRNENVSDDLLVVAWKLDEYLATNPPCPDFQPVNHPDQQHLLTLQFWQGKVLVEAATLNPDDNAEFTAYFRNELKAEVVTSYRNWVNAWVPFEHLLGLAAAPGLSYARQPYFGNLGGTHPIPIIDPPVNLGPEPLPEPVAGPLADPGVKTAHPAFFVTVIPGPATAFVAWDSGRVDRDIVKAFAGDTSIYRRKFSYSFPGASNDYDPSYGFYGQLEADGTLQVELNFRTRDPNIIETLRSQVTRLGSFYSGTDTGIADAWITLEDLEKLNANEELIRVHIPYGVVFS